MIRRRTREHRHVEKRPRYWQMTRARKQLHNVGTLLKETLRGEPRR